MVHLLRSFPRQRPQPREWGTHGITNGSKRGSKTTHCLYTHRPRQKKERCPLSQQEKGGAGRARGRQAIPDRLWQDRGGKGKGWHSIVPVVTRGGARKPAHLTEKISTTAGQHCAACGGCLASPVAGTTQTSSPTVSETRQTARRCAPQSLPPTKIDHSAEHPATLGSQNQGRNSTPLHRPNQHGFLCGSYTSATAAGTAATAADTDGNGRRVSWKRTASWSNSKRRGSPARISVEPRATTRGMPDDGSVNW